MAIEIEDQPAGRRMDSGWVLAMLYAAMIMLISIILLVCNAMVSYVIIQFIPMPEQAVASAVLTQLFYYIVPIGLTFFQWYLFDRLRIALRG